MTPIHRVLLNLFSIARTVQEFNLYFEKEHQLSLTQWLTLATLKDLPGCTALTLAQALSMKPSSLTQILKRLERKKLIHVSVDPMDSRKKLLSLSRDGKRQMDSLARPLKTQFGHLKLEPISKIEKSLKSAAGTAHKFDSSDFI